MSERKRINLPAMMAQISDYAPALFEHTSINQETPAIALFEGNRLIEINYNRTSVTIELETMATNLGLTCKEQLFCLRDELLVFHGEPSESTVRYNVIIRDLRNFLNLS